MKHLPRPTLRALAAALAVLALAACEGAGAGAGTKVDTGPRIAPVPPDRDPRVQPHLETFQRTEALLTRWDDLRADARIDEARALEPQLRQEVDGHFDVFARAATGSMGPHAQYLATSALGFSGRPEATRHLVDRLREPDGRLQGNALIALGLRADPQTPLDLVLQRIAPGMPETVKRYAPLALANVLEARAAAGLPAEAAAEQQALLRLRSLVTDPDGATRLHVVKALRALRVPGTFEPLQRLVDDHQMRVRWAAAGALADLGDPRGFPDVIRLLGDSAPESRHIVRDVLVTYAGTMRKQPLTEAEIRSLGTGPRAWGQWFVEYRRSLGLAPPRAVPQPVGGE